MGWVPLSPLQERIREFGGGGGVSGHYSLIHATRIVQTLHFMHASEDCN